MSKNMTIQPGMVPIIGQPPEIHTRHHSGPMSEAVGMPVPLGDGKVLMMTVGGRTRLEIIATQLLAGRAGLDLDIDDAEITAAFDAAEKIAAEADRRMGKRPK